jgi:hypothetical protein
MRKKGEEWSYKVFALACQLLCCRLTCNQTFWVMETLMRFMSPNNALRVPTVTTLEHWRIIMRDIVYWVNNIDAASKAYHLQTITDETVAGGVSLLGTGLRRTDCKGHCQDVIIRAGVLPAGQFRAEEFAEVMRRSTVTIGDRTVTVPHIMVVGGISDNAKGAVGVTNLYGSYKDELVSSLSDEMMEAAAQTATSLCGRRGINCGVSVRCTKLRSGAPISSGVNYNQTQGLPILHSKSVVAVIPTKAKWFMIARSTTCNLA